MGYLPNTNLGISAIRQEVVTSSGAMSTIGSIADPYIAGNQYAMSSYRGFQLPPTNLSMNLKRGGIWDGCNYWDVFCYLEGADPTLGQYIDPDFGYIGAYWTPNGNSFTQNNQRCNTCGTELTFDGGELYQQVHGRTTIGVNFLMIPQYTSFCTQVYMKLYIESYGGVVYDNCITPNTNSYTNLSYNLYCEPGVDYTIMCLVSYDCA